MANTKAREKPIVEAAKVVLSGEYSRRRDNLTNIIEVWNGLALTGTLTIWAFLMKMKACPEQRVSQIALAGALSSILLGFWRFYVHSLDTAVIRLYPAIYLCERALLSEQLCTVQPPYCTEPLPGCTICIKFSDLSWKKVRNSDFGSRGHTMFDWVAAFVIIFFASISIYWNASVINYVLLIGNAFGLVLVLAGWLLWKNKDILWPVLKTQTKQNKNGNNTSSV